MNIICELRKKKGIQQKELASIIGVSIPTISNWENGKSDPSSDKLKKLAEYFGVDELVILGKGSFVQDQSAYSPVDPEIA
jgi:transcriptional regulator with XRE-family HTH domain